MKLFTLKSSDFGSKCGCFPYRYRITIGNKTCVFQRENDPSLLRSPSAGKLIQYTVEDGGHVFSGQCYAEIEVQYVKDYVRKPNNATEKERVIPILLLIQTLFSTMFMKRWKHFCKTIYFVQDLKSIVLTLIENMDAFSLI